ncbi:hypothetical protein L1887_17094 [Cichorium endivia]|nr:hypothetical protein L1887_17094 [Cichorium endivia]
MSASVWLWPVCMRVHDVIDCNEEKCHLFSIIFNNIIVHVIIHSPINALYSLLNQRLSIHSPINALSLLITPFHL